MPEGDVLMADAATSINIVGIEVQQTRDIVRVPFMPEPVLDGEAPEVVVGDIFEDQIGLVRGGGETGELVIDGDERGNVFALTDRWNS